MHFIVDAKPICSIFYQTNVRNVVFSWRGKDNFVSNRKEKNRFTNTTFENLTACCKFTITYMGKCPHKSTTPPTAASLQTPFENNATQMTISVTCCVPLVFTNDSSEILLNLFWWAMIRQKQVQYMWGLLRRLVHLITVINFSVIRTGPIELSTPQSTYFY
jgi:hypothetical protein